ncbi:TadE/TadG family type IV pilus assembly protein [Vibrio agarivorans]|uniref:Pilus assembly protein n=1 Tax=Vibrio agarivorans TaxID=153622 RepID=A0ABT7Y6U5_9VIBR|nr:TadE/TadG family type IV pilus assembly protein [Vibrio agarivorans]MDN2483722.1 pilus assembly protein [Vibrio agarivorans]
MSVSKQRGHAAILFVMMVPIFFALFSLGSDGARMMQSKARLGDAMESAALAVTAHASASGSINEDIAQSYINYYFGDVYEIDSVSVSRRNCDIETECPTGVNRYFEYNVAADLKFKTWFPGNQRVIGPGDYYNVAGLGTARKFQSHAIDVVLATDFSGSMRNNWPGGNNARYVDLISVIGDVVDELKSFNDLDNVESLNTVGIAPYDHYTHHIVEDTTLCDNFQLPGTSIDYAPPSNNEAQIYRKDNIDIGRVEPLVINYDNNEVDYQSSIEQIYNLESNQPCYIDRTRVSKFYNIPLTSNFDEFLSAISSFEPDNASGYGFTASYAGFLEGAKILKQGTNKRKLLILLSDGDDSGGHTSVFGRGPKNRTQDGIDYPSYRSMAETLIDTYSMCDSIREYLNEPIDGEQVQAELAVIGFGFNPSSHPALGRCVGSDNVYQAENTEETLTLILSLIAEEIGRLR